MRAHIRGLPARRSSTTLRKPSDSWPRVPSAEALARDEKTLLAVVRALEVIGEAARHVAPAFRREHPEIPWRGMAGMRDKVIHGYFGVDAAVVWRTVKEDPPRVREATKSLLSG